jgi:hypothetical protein
MSVFARAFRDRKAFFVAFATSHIDGRRHDFSDSLHCFVLGELGRGECVRRIGFGAPRICAKRGSVRIEDVPIRTSGVSTPYTTIDPSKRERMPHGAVRMRHASVWRLARFAGADLAGIWQGRQGETRKRARGGRSSLPQRFPASNATGNNWRLPSSASARRF